MKSVDVRSEAEIYRLKHDEHMSLVRRLTSSIEAHIRLLNKVHRSNNSCFDFLLRLLPVLQLHTSSSLITVATLHRVYAKSPKTAVAKTAQTERVHRKFLSRLKP